MNINKQRLYESQVIYHYIKRQRQKGRWQENEFLKVVDFKLGEEDELTELLRKCGVRLKEEIDELEELYLIKREEVIKFRPSCGISHLQIPFDEIKKKYDFPDNWGEAREKGIRFEGADITIPSKFLEDLKKEGFIYILNYSAGEASGSISDYNESAKIYASPGQLVFRIVLSSSSGGRGGFYWYRERGVFISDEPFEGRRYGHDFSGTLRAQDKKWDIKEEAKKDP